MGLQPRNPDPELGYIVPGPDRGGGYREVEQFVECGWSDLGTPRRVAEVLRELENDRSPLVSPGIGQARYLSLAAQHARAYGACAP